MTVGPRPGPIATLPDYLRPGLELVFIGINPGLYSVRHGHYFARPTSRFWPAFSLSRLSAPARAGLGKQHLGPEDDETLLRFAIGFTDVVKTPSRNAGELRPADFARWAPSLRQRLEKLRPRVACFHGSTGYRAFCRYALGTVERTVSLGEQDRRLRITRLFVAPNPSPANAHFRLQDYVAWYDRLAGILASLQPASPD